MFDDAAAENSRDPIDSLIEQRPWSAFRLTLLAICFSVTLMDGAHQLTMAISGPAVASDIAVSSTGLGFLMAASELGFMLGALLLSPLIDRFGRKRMLLLSTLAFGLLSIATAFAHSMPILFITRLGTGVGLGCAGPAVVSLATEYAPARHRARIATLIWAANPAGAFASGLLGSVIIPQYGWRELFLLAGELTMVFVVLIAVFVPESLRFLLVRAPQDPRVKRILHKLGNNDVGIIISDPKFCEQPSESGVPVRILFEGRNARFTIALWIAFFFCFMSLLASLTWTVAILGRAGYGIATSSKILAFNSIGGTLGVASAGWAMERLGGGRLLIVSFVIGVLAIIGMGQALHSPFLLTIFSTVIGLCIGGNTAGLIALTIDRYPTSVRATGLGWALATGRLGGAMGPVLMGAIAGTGARPTYLFSAMAIPAILAALFVLPLARRAPPGAVVTPLK